MEDVQHQIMGYDRAATMFAPDGHILQVEYAEKTVRLGSPSIGMVCKDGVILVSDRRQKDKLIIESSSNKISQIDDHIMCVAAGILSDARILIDKARVISQQHKLVYDSPAHTESIVKEISDIKQQFTQYGGTRPFGTSLMIAGINQETELFVTDVTGNYLKYKAWAIGEDDEKLREKIREKYKENITCEEGIKLSLSIFKEIYGDKFEKERFDIGLIKKDTKKIEIKTGKDFL
ncbi:MAG: archaeal proteasome endopeptidase complex subunit alpha [Candidatus Pacearchaeota archaeon]